MLSEPTGIAEVETFVDYTTKLIECDASENPSLVISPSLLVAHRSALMYRRRAQRARYRLGVDTIFSKVCKEISKCSDPFEQEHFARKIT